MERQQNNPLVSIIITSYNRANLIEQAIDSALAQDYQNLEIVISDNNSTDNTDDVIKKYLADPRVKYFKNVANLGMAGNFRIATEERAKGEFLTYISSDDYLINERFISQAIKIINDYDNVLLVFGKGMTLLEKENILLADKYSELYLKEFKHGQNVFLNFANTKTLGWGAALINRKELLAVNIFNSRSSSVDYEANLLLMLKGNVGFIKVPTYVFRIHTGQVSQNHFKSAEILLQNYSYIFAAHKYADENKIFSRKILEKWKNDLLFLEARYVLLRFLPVNKEEYGKLISYFKSNHPQVYKRLKRNIKMNFLSFLYRRPNFSLKFIHIISKGHSRNLKNIMSEGIPLN